MELSAQFVGLCLVESSPALAMMINEQGQCSIYCHGLVEVLKLCLWKTFRLMSFI